MAGTSLDEMLLSQVLKAAGYRTAAIGKWHLGDAVPLLPYNRSFDEFFGMSGGGFNFYGVPSGPDLQQHIIRNGAAVPRSALTYLTDDFSNDAVRFIEENKERPFFLYLAYNAVHAPNHAPQQYLDRVDHIEYGLRSVYAAMTIAMDDGVGKVIGRLEDLGLRDNTLVVFVNDNGGRVEGTDNRPLRGHKGLLYEGGVRVPFLMSWPGTLSAGRKYANPVSSLDIFPTAAAAARADTSATKPLDGVNLIPYLTGKNGGAPHETLFWRVIGGQGYAVRHGDLKLVKPAARDEVMLFDLASDIREMHNLAASRPADVRRLQQLYDAWNAELMDPLWSDPHGENVKKERDGVMEFRRRALPPAR
jgi:arylsulfatase A-like enzyme